MVKEYLEKTRQKFVDKKAELTEKEKELHLHIRENIEFIRMLEEESDPNYESFTPRKVNSYNQNKIVELKGEQKILTEQLNEVRKELYDLNVDIYEIDSVIKVESEKIANENTIKDNDANPKYKITILQTQESERQRIARDLHDTTVQSLTSLVHKSELCKKLVDIDPLRCKLELSSMSKILRDVIEDTRKMIYNLRPMSFDDIGFDITVERFLDKMRAYSNVKYDFKVDGEPFDINPVVGITLLRVIEEACSNSISHGNASHICVTLKYVQDQLELIIEDDGCGFDMETIPETTRNDNSGFGLSMMKERIYLMSGELKIISSVGNGCKIIVRVFDCKENELWQ
ncbi:histidine kinase [Roseburia sp. MUC/MUC-530-WT-4D]|uniref:histidine kinase n=1 Tax=Roseburia porci TaxID=2605790 RepID=A0A6L5YV67_9FIRM|nr:sensor histidine kinase [Roseburia porci]MCI5518104.1 histidine kinase [Roseburia sp.]MST75866.1 histidine kinase [Roseburia porci]